MDTDTTRALPSPDSISDASTTALGEQSPTQGAKLWWFDDGNVVLIAEDTLFRVHRGILSHHSEVFRDMFMIPQPEELEQIEGCPVVHLSDTQKDLCLLLSTLYEGHRFFRSEVTLTFADVSAMLRLGTKYQVDHVREEAIHRLQRCFPNTLKDFPARNVYLQDPGFTVTEGIHLRKKDAIGVVNLARSFDLDFLLPPAFYLCAQLEYDELIDGVPDDCGGVMKLSSHDLKACVKGRDALTKADIRSLQPLFFPVNSEHCQKPAECVVIKHELIQELWYDNLANPNALVEATHWLKSYAEGRQKPLCPPCVEHLMVAYDEQRQQTWNSLGEYFSVSPWPIP